MGLGPIGARAAALAHSKTGLELVGAVDTDPEKAGNDVGSYFPEPAQTGMRIVGDAGELLRSVQPDVVLHCTSSHLPDVVDQLKLVADCGANLVSSTEQLLWPRLQHPELADQLDHTCLERGITMLGTGVNPGFVMDTLPAFASAVLYDARHVVCRRYVDASTRRLPFQKKIGAGMQEEDFRRIAAEGNLGHVGLLESIALLGAALGWEFDQIEQRTDPILAESEVQTAFLSIRAGEVAGVHNTGFGALRGKKLVEMDLRAYVGCPDPKDEFVIDGEPPLHVTMPGGTAGDLATAGMLVNCLRGVVAATPGLKTMLDLPVPTLTR